MAKWTLAPTTGDTVTALRDSLNQRLVDLDLILSELEQLEADLKGTPDRSSIHAGILDMQGNAIVGLPRQPSDVSSAVSLAFVQSGDFLYSTTNTVKTKKRIEGIPAQRGSEVPTFEQTQQAIRQALDALDALLAPPRVANISDIGLADQHFARQLHTHQGVNLDATQSITARKTFVTDLLTPLVLGSVSASGTLTLKSTEHATKGKLLFGSSAYDEVNNRLGVQQTTPVDAVHISGAMRLDTATVSSYISPLGSSVPTKINIPNFDPGAFGQCLALGLASGATATARVFTMLDQRAAGHQPSFQLISVDEGQGFGLTWDGGSTIAVVYSSAELALCTNGTPATPALHIDTAGRVTIGGTAHNASAVLELNTVFGAFLLSRMTSTQRDALTAVNGMLIYNTTTAKFQGYEAGAWTNLI